MYWYYILPFIIFPSEYLKTFLGSNCVEVAWNPGYKISVKTLVLAKKSIHPKNEIKFGCYSLHYGKIDIGIRFIAYNMNNETNHIIRQLSKHIFLKLKNSLPNLQKRCNTRNSTIYFLVYIVHNQHQMIHKSNTFLLWGSILDNDRYISIVGSKTL